MTDERLAELRAMFDEMVTMASKTHDDPRRRYQATDKVSLDVALASIATLCSGLVELVDLLYDVDSRLVLLHAHSENLIERVYLLEGGDLMADRQAHHHQMPGQL